MLGYSEQAEVIPNNIIKHDLSLRQTEELERNWSKDKYMKSP